MNGRLFSLAMLLYVASVVIVNLGFTIVPMIETAIGFLSPMAVVVGGVFVIRDYAQRQSGHLVLIGMVAATVLSYLLADPYVALASAAAFATSEFVDYLIYSLTKRPFHERVVLSSLISTPIDTAVFLLGISGFTLGTFLLMFASKMIAAIAIWIYYSTREPYEQPDIDEEGVDLGHTFPIR